MTHIGVESTARSGWNHGYNMVFVTDASRSCSNGSHEQA
jgi:nicotinamidase-related amidase